MHSKESKDQDQLGHGFWSIKQDKDVWKYKKEGKKICSSRNWKNLDIYDSSVWRFDSNSFYAIATRDLVVLGSNADWEIEE